MATGIHVTKKRCSFFNVGKCPFVICKLFDTRTNLASIEIGTIQHTDHKLVKSWAICPGMPKYTQSVVLSSPTKVDVVALNLLQQHITKEFIWTWHSHTQLKDTFNYLYAKVFDKGSACFDLGRNCVCIWSVHAAQTYCQFQHSFCILYWNWYWCGTKFTCCGPKHREHDIEWMQATFLGLSDLYCSRCLLPTYTREKWRVPSHNNKLDNGDKDHCYWPYLPQAS